MTPWARTVREVGTGRWTANPVMGDWFYNTHHDTYQCILKSGFKVFQPHVLEMVDAQFERWVDHMREVRAIVKQTITNQREAA